MKKSIVILSVLSAALSAQAATYTEIYNCFNEAEARDAAPAVSIVKDENYKQYLHIQALGEDRYVALSHSQINVVDGAVLEGDGVRVIESNGIERPGSQGATVQFTKANLTYTCSPAPRQ